MSFQENNKSSSKVRFASSKTPPRKAKTRISKNSVSQAAFNELNEINKPETITSEIKHSSVNASQHIIEVQKAVAGNYFFQEALWNIVTYLLCYYQVVYCTFRRFNATASWYGTCLPLVSSVWLSSSHWGFHLFASKSLFHRLGVVQHWSSIFWVRRISAGKYWRWESFDIAVD